MGVSIMNFYTCRDVSTNLPVTRYKGKITGITKSDDKAIAFTEELPLGDSRQRIIPSDSLFIGSVKDAVKFFSNEIIVVGHLEVIEKLSLTEDTLRSRCDELLIENNQLKVDREQLQLEIENLKSENERLHKDKLLIERPSTDENSLTLSSINILNRFL